jgi:4-hydroxy-tetrahydrodipicolinate reductase
MVKIAITGAAGRMGRRIASLAIQAQRYDIVSALEMSGHEAVGTDVGELCGAGRFGVAVSETLQEMPEVLIDFTGPEATMHWLEVCAAHGVAMVIGTTGLTESQEAAVADAASKIPVVKAGNYSLGITVLLDAVEKLSRALGADFDVEVVETHHRHKKDAPSGTAIMLAKAACGPRDSEYTEAARLGRGGIQPRTPGEVGMHAVRMGAVIGKHDVHFGSDEEVVTLSHEALTRDAFVRGALRAAEWLAGRSPGLYDVRDVLGLK